MTSELRETFEELLIVPLLSYGFVCWVHLIGVLT